jgi:bifunctional non-homologous end joining protein LigD
MLPHAEGRPLNMQRFPNGIDSQGLMQQPIADYFPRWVNRITLEKKEGGSITHVVCDNAATLVYLANLACLTPHIWRSRVEKLNCPDKMRLDLDPSEGFHQARSGALELKAILEDLGLHPFVMTRGTPRDSTWQSPWEDDRRDGFKEARSFARDAAELLVRRCPDLATTVQH